MTSEPHAKLVLFSTDNGNYSLRGLVFIAVLQQYEFYAHSGTVVDYCGIEDLISAKKML